MSGRKPSWRQVIAGAVIVSVLLFAALTLSRQIWAGEQVDTSWVEVYSDTFDNLNASIWTVFERYETGYEWGVTDYAVDSSTESGLWAAGGGSLGQLQAWENDTYPVEFMSTVAMAGPFDPAQSLVDLRLSFDVLNKVSGSAVTSYGISYDGINISEEIQILADGENWQNITWSPSAVESRPIWVGFRFFTDGTGVDTGPLLDNLLLEFRYQSTVYLPYVALEPTPTPIPVYIDDFTNPKSGWNTQTALRYNTNLPYEPYEQWEEVAYFSYIPDNYQIYVPLTWHGNTIGTVDTWFVWPAEKAPLPQSFYIAPDVLPENYCVETRARLVRSEPYDLWWAHWGLVFGANADRTEIYSLQVNANHDFAVLHHENYLYPGDRQETLNGEVINIENDIVQWSGNDYGTLIPTLEYNTLKVLVKGEQVFLYINGWRLDQIDPEIRPVIPPALSLPGMPKAWVGVIGGSWESTPVTIQYDYFKFATDVANCPELQ